MQLFKLLMVEWGSSTDESLICCDLDVEDCNPCVLGPMTGSGGDASLLLKADTSSDDVDERESIPIRSVRVAADVQHCFVFLFRNVARGIRF